MQGQAQLRHLQSIEELIQRYSIPILEDRTSSDHQQALDVLREHDVNEEVMKDMVKNMQVCTVESSHLAHYQ